MFVSEIVSVEELQEFFEEYDLPEEEIYETPVSISSSYTVYLSKVREDFYKIPKKNLKCLNKYDELFVDTVKEQRKVIAKLCSHCPVEFQCGFLAVLGKEEDGIWGGLETKQLRKIVKIAKSKKLYDYFDEEKNNQIISLIKKIKSK